MGLREDLEGELANIFSTIWEVRDGRVVPEPSGIQLGKDAVKLDATVLYADLAESTELVDGYRASFAAEIYKSYLHCSSKIIRSENGVITSFDGDRVMAVFVGNGKNTSAARAALKINHAVLKLVNPAVNAQYSTNKYVVRQAVGIDTGELFVARTGIRGSNDLVWVGRAANYAAKLCALRDGNYATWITKDVYSQLATELKTTGGKQMWEQREWRSRAMTVYRSNWWWPV